MNFFRNIFFLVLFFGNNSAHAQGKFSLATDGSLLHNFESTQKFTVFGQTLIPQFHIDNKTTFYAWISYHINGKYKNELTATAKSPTTQPQTISFVNESQMRLRQISLGVKQYLVGGYAIEEGFSLYAAGGFGLMHGRVTNNFSTSIDTSIYTIQNDMTNGTGDFKRLTFDITGGVEFPISYEIFVYSEMRVHIPTTDYPSKYLFKNSNAPFLAGINLGLRILFNADP